MRNIKLSVLTLLSTAFLFASCGTTIGGLNSANSATSTTTVQNTGSSSGGSSILNSLSSILGIGSSLKLTDLYGTWNYVGTDCRFESENLLKKAGGEVAAKQVEGKLDDIFSKVGIRNGACTFIFNSDNTFAATLGAKKISGTYAFDESAKKMTLTYLLGLGNLEANVTKTGSNLSLLFDADRILKLMTLLSSMSNNTYVKAAGSLAGEYDGMLVGFELKK